MKECPIKDIPLSNHHLNDRISMPGGRVRIVENMVQGLEQGNLIRGAFLGSPEVRDGGIVWVIE